MLLGVDLSEYQAVTPDLSGVAFAFVRTSIGNRLDAMYTRHMAAARAAHVVTGSYHFNATQLTVPDQLRTYLAGDRRAPADIKIIDVEGHGSVVFTDDEARRFVAGLQAADGRPDMLYASESGYPSVGQSLRWVAHYREAPPPGIRWDFWQYTSSGHLPGYSGRLDLNRFAGTRDQLVKLAGLEVPVIQVTNETPVLITAPTGTAVRDELGNILTTLHAPQVRKPSPFEAVIKGSHYRAFYATIGMAPGVRQLTFLHNSDIQRDPVPVADCSAQDAKLAAIKVAGGF